MAAVDIQIEGDVRDIVDLNKVTTTKINQFANEISDELLFLIKQKIQTSDAIATKQLFRSITSQLVSQFNTFIDIQAGSSLPYAEFAEEGRGPGTAPPVDVIAQWMIDKGIQSPYGLESGAYLIAKSIGRKGSIGKHFFRDALDEVSDEIPSIAKRIFG